jgi:hypothetical protein
VNLTAPCRQRAKRKVSYTQDKDFVAATPADQHAYLKHVDPDYAKASPADQQAYIQFIKPDKQ